MSLIGIVEVPKHSNHKYEMEQSSGQLILETVLDIHFPYNYGFIPGTKSSNGKPLSFFVLGENPINPLVKVKLELLGVLSTTDNSIEDNKLICKILGTNHPFDTTFSQISYFVKNHKVGVVINSTGDKELAEKILRESLI
jgi:inorganic pyrophosphatase